MQPSRLVYWLDANNRITSINGPWDAFALKNDGEGACTAKVLGKSIEEFVAGDDTRMYLMVLLSAVRKLGKTQIKEYRCDSPTEKRFMQMIISKENHDRVKIEHALIKWEPKQAYVNAKPQSNHKAGSALRCSICNHLKLNGTWMEEAEVIDKKLVEPFGLVSVAYTICDECHQDD